MKILCTGAAGFICSHLVDRLRAQEHTVAGVDNFLTGRRENTDAIVPGDISGEVAEEAFSTWAEAFQPDVIVHAAASYSDREKWHRDTQTNVQGSINVAIAARACNARVIYFQTALCYGNNPYKGMFTEADVVERYGYDDHTDPAILAPRPIRLDAPLNPENSYAISKTAGEQYLIHSGVPLLSLRLANIYGPRNLSGPIPTFYKRISEGDPVTVTDTRRDFVYIDDLVNLVTQAINTPDATGIYHVSTGSDFSVSQIYEAVCDAMDRPELFPVPTVPRGDDDAPTILLDPTKTRQDFGWQATTDLDEGVAKAVEWYAEHGVTDTYTHLKVGQ